MLILNTGHVYNVNINIHCILYVNIYILFFFIPNTYMIVLWVNVNCYILTYTI
jgi:hypothetical protein